MAIIAVDVELLRINIVLWSCSSNDSGKVET